MKAFILVLFILGSISGSSQTYRTNTVTIHCLDEVVSYTKQYQITRDGQWVTFEMITPHGSEGWAAKIIDSTSNGTYILDYHWITTFDSLQIHPTAVKLFNRTLDYIEYSKK